MRYRKQSPTGDYQFGASQKDLYRDEPMAVGQAAQTRLLLWLGEWFLDIEQGTPYMQGILGKHSQAEADLTIQDRILATEGVTNIENYESLINADNRSMSVTMTLNTIYGPTDLAIANFVNY